MSAIGLPENFHVVVPIVAGVGNALMALPLVRQLKSRARSGRVTVLARIDAMAEPFRRVDEVDEILVSGSGAARLFRAARGVRRGARSRPDLCVIPFPSNRWQYAALALAIGARQTLAHSYPVGQWSAMHFIGTRVPAVRGVHDVAQNLRLLEAIGVRPDSTEAPRFVLHDDDRTRSTELLASIGIAPSPKTSFVAVHAGSAQTVLAAAKRWPVGKYAKLIESIVREFAVDVVLLEGPDEAGVAAEITGNLGTLGQRVRTLKLVGNLGTAAAVLERAALYVGTDSGLAHLAAGVGTRPVTIFAPADPDRVCPFGFRELVVKPQKDCSPCFLYPWQATKPKMRCGEGGKPMCIEEVTVEQVMSVTRRALHGPIDSPESSLPDRGAVE